VESIHIGALPTHSVDIEETLRSPFCELLLEGLVLFPNGIRQASQPINYERLCDENDDRRFDDDEFFGLEMMPNDTISVVAPAGGWLARNRIINAPVAESERAAAMILGQ
jgi:hypothetical protein